MYSNVVQNVQANSTVLIFLYDASIWNLQEK